MTTLAPPPYVTSSSTTTPADYHKLLPSMQLPLPEQKFVGLLACQRESSDCLSLWSSILGRGRRDRTRAQPTTRLISRKRLFSVC